VGDLDLDADWMLELREAAAMPQKPAPTSKAANRRALKKHR